MRASAGSARNVEMDGLLSPQVGFERKGANLNQPRLRSLAGATILQLVPALRDDAPGRAALEGVRMLLQAGARAIVAGAGGPLAGALRSIGGEFLPMPNDTFNPLRIQFNVRRLSNLIASERIDIVHAHSAGAAWSAIAATRRMPVFLVTSFPDRLPVDIWPGSLYRASLSRGDRVIAPSAYVSRAVIERYKIAGARISVIPRAVDTAAFDPAAVAADRISALRRAWRISPQTRVVLVAGGFTPRNGQLSMLEAARLLVGGDRDIAFVFAGEERNEARHVRGLRRQAAMHGIDTFCRFVGKCADMPAALAPPTSWWCRRWNRRFAEAPPRKRRPWAGPWSQARSACCRKTFFARRACATNCVPAGWYGPAMRATSRTPSHPRSRSTSPRTRR